MSDDKEGIRVGPDPDINKDEFIKASINALSRLVDRAMQGDVEASDNLQTIAHMLTCAFKRPAPAAIQRALELRALKWSLAQVVKPSPSSSNKKGSVFHGSIVINEKCEGHPLYAEAKRWADSRMTLKSLSRRVFNAKLEQEGRPPLEKSQFDADEQQLKRWEKEQRQNNPSYLHYAPSTPQNADDLKEHSRKMFSKEQRYGSLEDTEAVYAVKQTWRERKTDRRRDKD
jgi:hypothetical protein